MLAAAGRSGGDTTAITYDPRVGTSICDSALRMSSSTITQESCGTNGISNSMTLAGRCVKTIVFTSPIRFAMRTATR